MQQRLRAARGRTTRRIASRPPLIPHPSHPSRLRAVLLPFSLSLLVVIAGCGKSASTSGAASAKPAASAPPDAAVVLPQAEPLASDLWARAKDNVTTGDGDDLARLADREGMRGILARADDPAWRLTAIHAMAYVDGFEPLPWLAAIAAAPQNDYATAALDAIIDMAARPRRAVDPEDGAELREGCDALLALAKDAQAAKARRIQAIRALRMLSERGCVAPGDIPADLDAH